MAKPVHTVDLYWPVRAAIWRNQDQQGRAFYSVTFEVSYKDKETGNYKSGDSYSGEDLLLLQKVAGIAHSKIYEFLKADREASRSAGREPGAEG